MEEERERKEARLFFFSLSQRGGGEDQISEKRNSKASRVQLHKKKPNGGEEDWL